MNTTQVDVGDGCYALQCLDCGAHTLSADEQKIKHHPACIGLSRDERVLRSPHNDDLDDDGFML